jgi:hypothetical protein
MHVTRTLKRAAFTLTALLVTSVALAAPPTDASIDALLDASHAKTSLDTMMSLMDGSMRQGFGSAMNGKTLTARQQAAVDDTLKQVSATIREEMTWANLHPLFLQVYRETYTQEEIEALTTFYLSPLGSSIVDKLPIVSQKVAAATQARMGPMMQKIQAEMAQLKQTLADQANDGK